MPIIKQTRLIKLIPRSKHYSMYIIVQLHFFLLVISFFLLFLALLFSIL